ncbi:ATP-grasp domain-containing protein [Labrenzia sp. DG1229]|uniref:ATP-grasp domain-containing protein n=1 Tax=Labrenzia sp. DG1229 TaxID=681847 RepID=UPI00068C74AF|nr:ATP-grasp domain-containing protein [Labrenzia sp. DG1229]
MAPQDKTDATSRSLVFQLLKPFCSQNNLRLIAGDPHGHAGLVESPDGKRWYFKGTRFDINPFGSAEIANDKAYTAKFLDMNGIAVPATLLVFGSDIKNGKPLSKDVLDFAAKHDHALFVKPNSGKEGRDVVRVDSYDALHTVLREIANRHAQILVQEVMKGRDIRIVVLDGDVLCAIERRPPQVTGDGRRRVSELVVADGQINPADSRFADQLSLQGLTPESVPAAGQIVSLLPVSNLSSGGSAQIITDKIAPDLLDLALMSTRSLGLRYAGVDLIVPEETDPGSAPVVLEVNAAPGLSNLYRQGHQESGLVTEIYARLFDTMFSN